MGGVFLNSLTFAQGGVFEESPRNAVFGGPENRETAAPRGPFLAEVALSGQMTELTNDTSGNGFALEPGSAVLNTVTNPLGSAPIFQSGVFSYHVAHGDTLSKVAVRFGVSVNTILWANLSIRAGYLTPGEEITILPVSGVLHTVESGDTFGTIANFYGVSETRIRDANAALAFAPGVKLIVPDGRPKRNERGNAIANLPLLRGYFTIPVSGWNWGKLHPVNAVDIANACGTPVYASAEGLVVEVGAPSSWNGGYGGFVRIEHPNGTATRYAHLSKVSVAEGDYMERRQEIGEIGNSGNTHGPTGCHLHFEVEGAANPFAK